MPKYLTKDKQKTNTKGPRRTRLSGTKTFKLSRLAPIWERERERDWISL